MLPKELTKDFRSLDPSSIDISGNEVIDLSGVENMLQAYTYFYIKSKQ